jgi:flagellar biosynthesis/type III secretory pathway protein FliH
MQSMLNLKIDRPIQNARILTDSAADSTPPAQQEQNLKHIESQKAQLNELCSNFRNIIETLSKMQSQLFKQHKEDISNLAVEIARKILAYKVNNGDYEIQEIIKQAIENSPVQEDITIRLNPDDYANIEQLMKTPDTDFPKGVTFIADAKIKPANCSLETPKGIVESFIEEHLEKISEALKKTG